MTDVSRIIAENLAEVRGRIADAAARSGRPANSVRLVGVTKYVDAAATRALVDAGCHDLGESRPQHLWAKAAAVTGPDVRWHLIGRLQRNKVRRTLPLLHLLHSLESDRVAAVLQSESQQQQRATAVLVEVNISGDATKDGLAPEAVAPLLTRLTDFPQVSVRGLMAMSHREGDVNVARRDFAAVRLLRDRLLGELPASMSLDELSMGMSDDFEAAILEGSTIVRIGSALFRGAAE